jgi:subtilisin family serine protease
LKIPRFYDRLGLVNVIHVLRHHPPNWFCSGMFILLVAVSHSWAADPEPRSRVLVKLRSPLAEDIEAVLPADAAFAKPAPARVQQWLDKHSIANLRPLYGHWARAAKARGVLQAAAADAIRAKFPIRAARSRARSPEVLRTYIIDLNLPPDDAQALARRLENDPDVEFAEVEQTRTTQFVPNDPFFATSNSWSHGFDDLWGLKKIDCVAAWDSSRGSNVIVAIIDTGIDYTRAEIAAMLWTNAAENVSNNLDDDANGYTNDVRGWNFVSRNNAPTDGHGHGTHVAGTVAAEGNNGKGVIGVAWGARVMALKALSDEGLGYDSQLAEAIVYAANNGADIINASWGSSGYSATMADAINYATSLGVLFVAAAGNSAEDVRRAFPAGLSAVVCVGATDGADQKASFSNFGPRLDVAAPGVSILSLRAANTSLGQIVSNDFVVLNGTSMAAPHTAGTAALLLSLQPALTVELLRQTLRISARDLSPPGRDDTYGSGRISASNALGTPLVSEARILTPSNGVIVTLTNTFSGVAQGGSFASYVLDVGNGSAPVSWTVLRQSSNAVDHAALGGLDSGKMQNGFYTVRLRVFDVLGRVFEDRLLVEVRNVYFSDPAMPAFPCLAAEFKPGTVLSLRGTAIGSDFRSYTLSWARGSNANAGWSTDGIALTDGGTTGKTNSLLGTWDTSSITQADYFTFRLLVDQTTFTTEAKTFVYLEPDLISTNWPKLLTNSGPSWCSLTPLRQADGTSQLVWADAYGTILRFSPAGDITRTNVVPGFLEHYPAARNLSGTLAQELVVGGMRVLRPDGTFYQLSSPSNMNLAASEVALADLDGDGVQEIIAVPTYWSLGSLLLHAWNTNGQIRPGFPVVVPDVNSYPHLFGRMVTADLDGDGKSEIVLACSETATSFMVRIFGPNGQPISWPARTYPKYFWGMIAADVDGDSAPEIILSYSTENPYTNFVEVLSANGVVRAGWPQMLRRGGRHGFLCATDLDRDGQSEILVTDGSNLHVFRKDGTPFPGLWPLLGGDFDDFGAPVVTDIDSDGFPEIIVTRAALPSWRPPGETQSKFYHTLALHVYRRDGTLARRWTLLGFKGDQPNYLGWPIVGDFDNDGQTDVAVKYSIIAGGGLSGWLDQAMAKVIALKTPWRPSVHDWLTPAHDAQQTWGAFTAARLTVSTSPQRTTVSWPLRPYAAQLQESPSLIPPQWTNSTASITTSNGLQRITVPRTNAVPAFYRLQYQ